ncbi:SMP-30/gluconolactonase/LRE family protein [Albidovulum sp.]|uniref:SMP-30/gluconolactonase/LRE family protein n=1 Tax=Albidovulum sp. TaxID=1872424 RepID=UPI001D8CCE20|nr:SMP-30/gluconolactonase/LRE family protein [Paracoccaceae bacterium]MCC0046724.1 SMP-30/gluconolactonase/LRE family protein [Defluviimonas sp.]HRV64049.1 SMP-30/gluconolactonase/LRE family protein [Albidovulum sp.]MCB2117728.1 SMP-30/gluconolactonase/LRE family protein [Paracoccaceae bacterium]MCB2121193.1 SMP-30/gluconolactonase/LRE family protein [Paracoccaceae bacterium]
MQAAVYDERICELGEGPFWHPERGQLFWFDILGRRLLTRAADRTQEWRFDEHVSAAGWIDRDTLLIASETGLYRFGIATGARSLLHPLEAENPETRSNDGRADPFGGFWIGTMGKRAQDGAGAIYRMHEGRIVKLFDAITIPNSICFAPDGRTAYFADTPRRQILRQPLDAAGWPTGAPAVFVDLNAEGLNPDGSVVDAEGALWNAQWGAGRVARYLPDGTLDRVVPVGGRHSSCPAFGGAGLRDLFVTTAREGLSDPQPGDGVVYSAVQTIAGLAEHRVSI